MMIVVCGERTQVKRARGVEKVRLRDDNMKGKRRTADWRSKFELRTKKSSFMPINAQISASYKRNNNRCPYRFLSVAFSVDVEQLVYNALPRKALFIHF